MTATFLVPPPLEGTRVPERVFGCNYGLYPIPNIFMLIAAALLERNGYQVSVVDAAIARWTRERFARFLASDSSSVYVIYSVELAKKTDRLAWNMIREARGSIPVIFAGPAPTYDPDGYLLDEETIIVRGEVEMTIDGIVGAIARGSSWGGIAGISYMHGSRAIHAPSRALIEDLDSLPFPARHLVDRTKYYNPKLGLTPNTAVLTSRGCGYSCIYCVPCSLSFARELEYKAAHGRKPPVRLRSVDNVLAELSQLAQAGFRSVSFLDDQFVWGERRTVALCEGIAKLGLTWGCLARADVLTEPIVRAMAVSGCRYVDVGVESFDQRVLDFVRKDMTVGEAERGICLLTEHGIMAKLNILIGAAPFETKETFRNNFAAIDRLRPNAVMFSICTPFPGTDLYELAVENGWLARDGYRAVDVQKEALLDLPFLSASELERLAHRANIRFYLNPAVVWRNIRSAQSSESLVQMFSVLRGKLRHSGGT